MPQVPDPELKYQIGIDMIPRIGSINAKKLIAYCGGVEAVFRQKKRELLKIPGIGEGLAHEIVNQSVLHRAEQEVEFIHKYNIKALFFLNPEYPERLRQCDDGPIVLFVKGDQSINLNHPKFLSIVGTRKATSYGKQVCDNLIAGFAAKGYDPYIISGLAYGIDVAAHRSALKNNLKTLAVLGHGLDTIYPGVHRSTAKEILQNGALLTDFPSGTKPDRSNFIKRNRIIAGLSDATIVIESGPEGGALITADLANSYNREVFAVPGNVGAKYSEGCNSLIKSNRAALVETADDIEFFLGWQAEAKNRPQQTSLFQQFSPEEQTIIDLLRASGQESVDLIALRTGYPVARVLSLLLNLEFAGVVKSKPGKVFALS